MILTILLVLLILAAGYLLTHKAIPWLFVHAGRRLGFRMKMTPITQKRIARFKRIKRGYWSYIGISSLFVTSLFLELFVNDKPLIIHYDGTTAFPAVADWADKALFFVDIPSFQKRNEFGQAGSSEVDYKRFGAMCDDPALVEAEIEKAADKVASTKQRFLSLEPPGPDATESQRVRFERRKERYETAAAELAELERGRRVFSEGGAWILPALYSYSPNTLREDIEGTWPEGPSIAQNLPLGTTEGGRDVLVVLLYGFRISMAFALVVALVGYLVGVIVGGIQGYYGGWVDILTQRFVEIWGSIPFLLTIMIIASLVTPTFLVLAIFMIVLRSWLGITFYVRGEFYREKAKDYVQAAIGAGVSDWRIITRHILPNSLVPIVTFAPFGIVAYIGALVSLDYLGFGLPPGTPSWGALLREGLQNVKFHPHLVIVPVTALATTLYAVVMIGEAVREAFDPKVFSRLR